MYINIGAREGGLLRGVSVAEVIIGDTVVIAFVP